jgi:hypothetical protein
MTAIPTEAAPVEFSNSQCAVLRQMRVDTRDICPAHTRGPAPHPSNRAQAASYSPSINGSKARPSDADIGGSRPAGGAGDSSGGAAGSGEPGSPGHPDRPGVGSGEDRFLRPSQLPSFKRPTQPEGIQPPRERRPKINNDIRGDVEHPRVFIRVINKLNDRPHVGQPEKQNKGRTKR